MNWEQKKAQVLNWQDAIMKKKVWSDFEYIGAQKKKIDLAAQMVMPCEERAERLLPHFREHVERKAKNDRVPDREVELLHNVLEVLENMMAERKQFTDELSRLHNEQARYWEQHARAKSRAMKEMDVAFSMQSEIITTLFTIHEGR